MTNPYRSLPDFNFWSRSMSMMGPGDIDPVVGSEFRIAPTDRVATMGSCFAQHVSRRLREQDFGYFIAEAAPDAMTSAEAARRNYGVFSARYGNVYTVRQAVQLFKRAFGQFEPAAQAWMRGNRFVDPFRPQVEPDGFASLDELLASRAEHLAAVRRVFTESDVIVFTLGLTEGWQSREDGAVFPMAPGVSGGSYDPATCGFVNFDVHSVLADLEEFCQLVLEMNRRTRIVLTVSPVPLIATYENRHVLVSTVASKSILRTAADEIERTLRRVSYFPSYEIITAPGLSERYYDDDLREVTSLGVGHVMRLFEKHLMGRGAGPAAVASATPTLSLRQKVPSGVICDEAAIELSVAQAAA